MEIHLLTASTLRCPEVQALVSLKWPMLPHFVPFGISVTSTEVHVPEDDLQSASGLGCSQVWPSCELQPHAVGHQRILLSSCPTHCGCVSRWQQNKHWDPRHATASPAWALPAQPQHWLHPFIAPTHVKNSVSSRVQGAALKAVAVCNDSERKLGVTPQVLGQDSGATHPVWCKTPHSKTVLS